MITNTVRTDAAPRPPTRRPPDRSKRSVSWRFSSRVLWLSFALTSLISGRVQAGTVLGSWVPLFKGIEHVTGTNTAGSGGMPDLQVMHCLRVDLTDPDIRLYTSPRHTNYVADYIETSGYTATNFLKNHGLQVAVNANSFYLPNGGLPGYTLAEGTALNVSGLLVSQGVLVSPQSSAQDCSAVLFSTNNTPTIIPTNWPAASTAGVFTAVSGLYPVLVSGVNVGSNYNVTVDPHGTEPRTALGLSQDRRFLYMLVIDGRQSGYSVGAYDWETAIWLLLVGAWDGVNMDGGGSTCLVVADSAGQPVPLNRDNASPASGRERTVGAHLGIYAAPLPGFFNDIKAQPDDTAATLTWTTTEPVTTQVQYGLTSGLGMTTTVDSALTTNHAALLTNLSAGSQYYFTLHGTSGSTEHVSSMLSFQTTNYATTHLLFDFTNAWKYTTTNLDGVAWTTISYDDSAWTGPGAGLLWADTRGANANIPLDMNTEMPIDSSTGYPFRTYYFRTHFSFAGAVSGVALGFEAYLDDGAVLYLNGTEIQRLYLAAAPSVIVNTTLASGYYCSSGDATCPNDFAVSGLLVSTNLVVGDNVLAAEVHNYSAKSPDITFGLSATYTQPYVISPTLDLVHSNGLTTLSWNRGGFTLQQAASPIGPWSDVPGPVVASPFVMTYSNAASFFRLKK